MASSVMIAWNDVDLGWLLPRVATLTSRYAHTFAQSLEGAPDRLIQRVAPKEPPAQPEVPVVQLEKIDSALQEIRDEQREMRREHERFEREQIQLHSLGQRTLQAVVDIVHIIFTGRRR